MRHRKKVKKLGRTASHRKATLRNIASALIQHHQIRTTLAKASAAQRYIERLITYGKKDTVHSRRLAFKFLQNRTLVKALFDEIAPTYEDRNGGYTRIVKLGRRQGDGAQLAVLQLVGFEELLIDERASKKKKSKAKPQKTEKAPKTATKVTPEEEAEEVVSDKGSQKEAPAEVDKAETKKAKKQSQKKSAKKESPKDTKSKKESGTATASGKKEKAPRNASGKESGKTEKESSAEEAKSEDSDTSAEEEKEKPDKKDKEK